MPEILEYACEWRSPDVQDESAWTEVFDAAEVEELDAALHSALEKSTQLLDVGQDDFPLPTLADRLLAIERELIDGRGFVLLRGIPRERYDRAQMEMLYWGIGMHLGTPWPQNQHGHVLGDVVDQGKSLTDPTARGNEIGQAAFPYHSDGADLVGLMCLQRAKRGGLSTVANAVAIHNDMVREAPHLAAALYAPQPYDFRGAQARGGKPWYELPVFTSWNDRLFVRYIRPYILASQRHPDAPRIEPRAEEAMQRLDAMTRDHTYNVFMDFEPGDIQFVNNYHVLHARTAYHDEPETGLVRHLKRLWLGTDVLTDRPPYFRRNHSSHWERRRTVSRVPVPAPPA